MLWLLRLLVAILICLGFLLGAIALDFPGPNAAFTNYQARPWLGLAVVAISCFLAVRIVRRNPFKAPDR